ncbi:hypothetical protein [Hyalangium gracile]|uniref:hypothetical protein n=1 Tax=Hyalangium gracile TaxID=394092 RepID=UPI001CCA5A64|nr:hypothetical protein [Hyalangium gracile]
MSHDTQTASENNHSASASDRPTQNPTEPNGLVGFLRKLILSAFAVNQQTQNPTEPNGLVGVLRKHSLKLAAALSSKPPPNSNEMTHPAAS